MQRTAVLTIFSVVLILGSARPSFGQGFDWTAASARSLGMGGTYVPSSSDPLGALSANPAGLTYLSAPSVDLDVTGMFLRGSFSNSVNTNSPLISPVHALPYGAFGMPIRHSHLSFGVGFAPDLASISDWRYVDAPGVAGATYGKQEEKSAILAGRSMAGVGVSLGRKLSFGATVGVDYNSNTLITPYTFQQQPVLAGLKTLLNLQTTGTGWNTSLGVIASPVKKVQLGVAWKSRTIIDSTGSASGNVGAQLAALGLGGAPAGFNYSAAVHNVLPQSILASVLWSASSRWTVGFQTDWIDWQNAFVTLPVTLTNGTNAAINGLLNSSTLVDGVPLNWGNQTTFHVGVERLVTESFSVRAGFAAGNNPVPSSTLLPLTAAIMSNQLSAGGVYHIGRTRFEGAYTFDPTTRQSVTQSLIKSGEYNNSTVHLGTQGLTLNTSFQF